MINKNLLKSKMALFGDTNQALSEFLDISVASMSNKLNGKVTFRSDEILKIASRYELNAEEVADVFGLVKGSDVNHV